MLGLVSVILLSFKSQNTGSLQVVYQANDSSNAQSFTILYQVFGRNIEEDLAGETRGDLKHLFLAQIRGERDELAEIERGQALQDARDIFEVR